MPQLYKHLNVVRHFMETSENSRRELVKLVQEIIAGVGTEQQIDDKIELLCKSVTDPNVTNYIFNSVEELTAEQIVDKALNYKPITL